MQAEDKRDTEWVMEEVCYNHHSDITIRFKMSEAYVSPSLPDEVDVHTLSPSHRCVCIFNPLPSPIFYIERGWVDRLVSRSSNLQRGLSLERNYHCTETDGVTSAALLLSSRVRAFLLGEGELLHGGWKWLMAAVGRCS